MEYRIKMIQQYNGNNLFISQYRQGGWEIRLGYRILLSPFVFLLWILFAKKRKWNDIQEYFDMWDNINYDKKTFKEIYTFFSNESDAICDNRLYAEEIIKVHKQDRENKLKKELEEELQIKMGKTKKVLYIKVND